MGARASISSIVRVKIGLFSLGSVVPNGRAREPLVCGASADI